MRKNETNRFRLLHRCFVCVRDLREMPRWMVREGRLEGTERQRRGRGRSPAGAVGSPGSVKVIWISRNDPNSLL